MTRRARHAMERPDPENVGWRDWVGAALLILGAAALGVALNVWGTW